MDIQSCLYCKKEFMPRRDGRSHSFCSRDCRMHFEKAKARMNKAFRRELGLSEGTYLSKYKKD